MEIGIAVAFKMSLCALARMVPVSPRLSRPAMAEISPFAVSALPANDVFARPV